MKMPRIVAFVGPLEAGKTTAASVLVEIGYTRISFADPLKKMLIAFGLTSEQVYGNEKEVPAYILGGKTPRFAMQTLGTEWGRDLISKDLWVRAWEFMVQSQRLVVVDDARFPNEFALIRSLNGKVIRIERPSANSDALKYQHESEKYREVGDDMVINSGSLVEFKRRVIATFRDMVG